MYQLSYYLTHTAVFIIIIIIIFIIIIFIIIIIIEKVGNARLGESD